MADEKNRAEALEYYNKSPEIKAQALRFFNSMDRNGDGTITKEEFSRFVEKSKFLSLWMKPDMFQEFDMDDSGELDFDEFITFFYKVFTLCWCDGCRQGFRKDTGHLSCAKCFRKGLQPFNLCITCHSAKNYRHEHDDFQKFGSLVCEYVSKRDKLRNGMEVVATAIDDLMIGWSLGTAATAATAAVAVTCNIM